CMQILFSIISSGLMKLKKSLLSNIVGIIVINRSVGKNKLKLGLSLLFLDARGSMMIISGLGAIFREWTMTLVPKITLSTILGTEAGYLMWMGKKVISII